MSITPTSSDSLGPMRFGSDGELFSFIKQRAKGKYASAEAVVNDWWKTITECLYYADVHFGWDALDPDSCSGKVMPPELNDWCIENGLDTPAKIYKARAIYRASLLTNSPIEYLINEVGVSKTHIIGKRAENTQEAEALLHKASSGSTVKQLSKEPVFSPTTNDRQSDEHRDLKEKSSPEHDSSKEIAELKLRIAKAEAEVAKAKSVKPKVDKTAQDQLSAVLQKIVPGGYRTLPVEKQVELATQTVDSLNKRVHEAEDITKVTPQNLEHRLECVNLDAVRWGDLAYCFGAAREVCTDASMIARAEDGVRKSWTAWIEHMPLDMLSDLKVVMDNRLNAQDDCSVRTMTTIDV